jgi:hypothetical protein
LRKNLRLIVLRLLNNLLIILLVLLCLLCNLVIIIPCIASPMLPVLMALHLSPSLSLLVPRSRRQSPLHEVSVVLNATRWISIRNHQGDVQKHETQLPHMHLHFPALVRDQAGGTRKVQSQRPCKVA